MAVAKTGGLKAIALGWNNSGGWVARIEPTLDGASTDAVQTCTGQYGDCTLSDVHVAQTAYGCLVVGQGTDQNRLFAAAAGSLEAARNALVTQMTNAGQQGQIVYSACNA